MDILWTWIWIWIWISLFQDKMASKTCTEDGTWWIHPDSNRFQTFSFFYALKGSMFSLVGSEIFFVLFEAEGFGVKINFWGHHLMTDPFKHERSSGFSQTSFWFIRHCCLSSDLIKNFCDIAFPSYVGCLGESFDSGELVSRGTLIKGDLNTYQIKRDLKTYFKSKENILGKWKVCETVLYQKLNDWVSIANYSNSNAITQINKSQKDPKCINEYEEVDRMWSKELFL